MEAKVGAKKELSNCVFNTECSMNPPIMNAPCAFEKKFSHSHKLMPQRVFNADLLLLLLYFISGFDTWVAFIQIFSPCLFFFRVVASKNSIILVLYAYKFLNVHQFNSNRNRFIATIFCRFNNTSVTETEFNTKTHTLSHSIVIGKLQIFSGTKKWFDHFSLWMNAIRW